MRGNSNSRKFGVSSDPVGVAADTRKRPGGTVSGSKRYDKVAFVAPSCIKGWRLVTLQLPKNFSPIQQVSVDMTHIA